MSKRPSILFLSQWYWPEPIGTGFAIARTAEILIERFSTVTVFTTRPHYPGAKIYNDYVSGELDHQVQNGVAIERLWTVTAKGGGLIARIKSEFAFFLSVMWRRLFGARINFDIVISVCPSIFAVFAGWLYALGGRRHVCIVHDIQSGLADGLQLAGVGYIARIIRFLERFAFNRCDALVVLNEGMRSELHSIGVTKPVMVIPP
ncbi:MAG: glycosyltransferase, partial [Pseudomonadota bacterium]